MSPSVNLGERGFIATLPMQAPLIKELAGLFTVTLNLKGVSPINRQNFACVLFSRLDPKLTKTPKAFQAGLWEFCDHDGRRGRGYMKQKRVW
jgi:hypothetical protein